MKVSEPQTYRECSQPKTPEQAQQDWEAFCEECYELRCRYRIADLYLVGQHSIQYEYGDGVVNGTAHFGDPIKRESLAAWALGFESSQRQAAIAKTIKNAADDVGCVRHQRHP